MSDTQNQIPSFDEIMKPPINPRGQVPSFEDIMGKKKVSSLDYWNAGLNGGEVGTSVPQLDANDPVKAILQPKREQYKNTASNLIALNQNEKYHSEQQGLGKPIPTTIADFKQQQQTPDELTLAHQEHNKSINDLATTSQVVKNNLFKNGNDAKKLLTNRIVKNGRLDPNNETENLAKERASEYNDVYNGVKGGDIKSAAINERLQTDEPFAKQYAALQKEGLSLPNAVEGETMANYMYKHGADLDELSKDNPDIKKGYENARDNLLTTHPDYGIGVVANKISQAREKLGYNSTLANFDTEDFRKHNDKIAKTLSPEEQKIWKENKDAITDKIDTGGMLNRFEESIEGGWGNTKGLFQRLTLQNTKGERISDEMVKEATSVNNGEKGWKKSLGTVGGFGGTIAYMMAGGNVAGGVGINPTVAEAATNVGTFAEDFMRQGEMKYPENTAKALMSGIGNTLAFAALSPFKSGKLSEIMGKVSPEIDAAVKDLPENASANTAKKTIINAFETGLKNYGQGVSELTGLPAFNQGLDKLMGLNQQAYQKYHPEDELENTMKNAAIGMIVPSVLHGAGEVARNLPPKEELSQPIPETKQEEQPSLIEQAKSAANEVPEMYRQPFLDNTEQSLKEISEQLHDPNSAETTRKTFGDNISNIALQLHPKTEVSQNIAPEKNFQTMNMGNDEGQPETKEEREKMKERFFQGDIPVDGENGKGETGRQFAGRVLSQWEQTKQNEDNNTTVVTHSSVLKAIKAYEGMKDKPEDPNNFSPEQWKEFSDAYNKESTDNGDLETFKGTNGDIHVIRHGQTEDNEQNKFRSGNTPLTEKGVDQAHEVGKQLQEKTNGEVPKIISSDLPRAIHSSNIINDQLATTPKEAVNEAKPKENDYDTFKNHVLDEVANVKDNSLDFRLSTGLDQKEIEQAVRNIKEGKNTKAAQILLASIKGMHDDGFVYMNRGRGNHVEKLRIPIDEYMGGFRNKHVDAAEKLPDYLVSEINEKGITLDNIDQFKELFNGFPYDETDFNNVKAHLAEQGGRTNETTQASAEIKKTNQEEVVPEELPFGKQETTGISHELRQARTYDTKSDEPLRGEGVTVEESIQHGNDLLKDGKDPNAIAEKFAADPEKNISYNGLSVVRAQNRVNVKATDAAADKFGENSPEYKQAIDKENKFYNEVVKPMQTEWSKIGQAQQGEQDIDTGSFMGLKRAKERMSERSLTKKEIREAKGLSDKVKTLNKKNEVLSQKLTDALNKAQKTSGKTIKEGAKNIANLIRKGKTSRPGTFSAATPASLVWDAALEIMAKTVELGGTAAQAIADGLAHIKTTEWYKGLSPEKQSDAEKDFNDHFAEADIFTKFTDKKDSKFSPDEAKEIWDYAKESYTDKGVGFGDMVHKVAMDLGLKPQQVVDAIATPKGAKEITNEMYRTQYERNKVVRTAQNWAKSENKPVASFLDTIASPFRSLATLGHGHALLFTHAAPNLFDYRSVARFFTLAGKQFKIVYGNEKNYAQAESSLTNNPLYDIELRSGLAVDPHTVYDDWQLANNFLKKLKIQGNKGFLILKMMRHEIFKSEYNKLSDVEKADDKTLKNIAQLANHWTGTAGIKPSATTNAFIFAPNLIVSKWARATTDPLKAIATLTKWKTASIADKAAAKMIIRKSGRVAAGYIAALVANQAMLSLTGSNQNVNLYNPFKSDWLKFKVGGGKTLDLSGGMLKIVQLMTQLGALPFEYGKEVKTDYYGASTADDALKNEIVGYFRGTVSPFGGTVYDVLSHKDFEGNVLPFFKDKPRTGKENLSVGQYMAEKLPIPFAEGFRDFHNQLTQNGVEKSMADRITGAFIVGALGSAGIKIGNEPKSPVSSFTDEDLKDKRVSWVHDDWKMELPNTVPSSENITDEDKATKIKLSKYPQKTQDQYTKTHKDNLFEVLGDIKDNGIVYVKKYKDDEGNPVNEVSLKPPTGDYDEKGLKTLSDNEKAQVLSLAQKEATKRTKKEIFNQ